MAKGFGISTKAQLDIASVNQVKKEFTTLIRDLQNLANKNYVNIRVNQSTKEMQNLNNKINNVNNAMNDLNGSNRTFAQQMTHVISKVAQWTLGMTAVYGTIRKVKEGFSFIADIDKKLTDISMITNKAKENLQEYAKTWNDTAIALKTTTDEVVDAEEKYLRAGKSIDEANKMTETNIKLARIANDTNEQTAEYLVTLSNAYKLNADGVEKYANKVAYLDSTTATNTKNINKTATAVAQTAQQTGMSMDFMLGIVSTIQEKSKQAPESIGRALRSMLINMQNVTKEGGAELSKLEETLNKRGIALRKNENEWRSSEAIIKDLMAKWNEFDDVSKSTIQSKLAGKVGAEAFNIVMNDQTRVMENYNNVLNATDTLNQKYEKHLDSVSGATAELQAKSEKMWLKLIDSSAITNGIKLLTKTVTILDELVNHNKLLGAGLLALSIQFIGLIKGVNLFSMALTALKGVSLATFTALATNPITWIAVAIGGVIALTNHFAKQREEVEKLTQEYKDLHTNLNNAFENNDLAAMEQNTNDLIKKQTELKDLLAKRQELQKQMDDVNNKSFGIDSNYEVANDFGKINNQINNLTKALKDAGFTVDEVTGEIMELSKAQTLLANKEIADNIIKQADAELKHRDEIISLINEYKRLNEIQDKNAIQRERLSQLSQILQSKIGGLIVTKDKEGNVTIQNTDLLDKEVSMLKTEGATVETLTKVKLENAKQSAVIQIGTTKATYAEVKKRIAFYQAELKALSALGNGRMDILSEKWENGTITQAENEEYNNMQRWALSEGVRASTNIQSLSGYINELDKIYSHVSDNLGNISSIDDETFISPDSGANSSSKSSSSTSESIFNATPINRYDSAIQTINNSLSQTDDRILNISQKINNLQSLESKSNYSNIIAEENKKLDEQNKKLSQIKSSQSQARNIQSQIIQDIYNNWSWMKGKDLSALTETDWTNLYNKYYGKDINFGTGDSAKAKEQKYQDGAKKFQDLMKNYQSVNELINQLSEDELKTQQEINSTIKERFDLQMQGYDETLSKQEDAVGDIQDKLDLLEANDSKNVKQKVVYMEDLLKAEQASLDKITKIRDSLVEQKSKLPSIGLEWNLLTEQIETYNEKIDEGTLKVANQQKALQDEARSHVQELIEKQKEYAEEKLKQDQENAEKELAKNTYSFTNDEWTKYHNAKLQRLTDEYNAIKEFERLNGESQSTADALIAKEQELNYVTNETFDSITDYQSVFEDIHNEEIKAIDDKIAKLNEQNDLQKIAEERQKRQLELEKLRLELENTRNQKNIQQLQKTRDGLYQFTYVADEEKLKDLTEQIKEKEQDNATWEADLAEEQTKKRLEQEKQYEEDLLKVKQNAYDREKAKLDQHYSEEEAKLNRYYSDMNVLVDAKMNEMQSIYGTNWEEINSTLITQLENVKTQIETIFNNVHINPPIYTPPIFAGGGGSSGGSSSSNWSQNAWNSLNGVNSGNYDAGSADFWSGLNEINGLATGGKTTDWNDGSDTNGKLVLLHPNEIVNNPVDSTKLENASKLLASVDLNKSNVLPNLLSNLPKLSLPSLTLKNNQPQTTIYQVDKIELPNVTNDSGVQNLIDSFRQMPRLVTQYNPKPV